MIFNFFNKFRFIYYGYYSIGFIKFYNFCVFLKSIKKLFLILNSYNKTQKFNWFGINSNLDISNNILKINNPLLLYKNNGINLNYLSNLNNIIVLKKKTSLIKKINDCKYVILNKIDFNKNNFKGGRYIQPIQKHTNNKIFDVSRKIKPLINTNRGVLSFLLKNKKKKQTPLNKFFKNLNNSNKWDLLNNLNFNIINFLLRTDIFFTSIDILWFLKNSLISVNGFVVNNKKLLIKPKDVLNISLSSYYFNFYKNNLNNNLNNIFKIKYKLWSITNNRLKNLNLKENYPKWLNNYQYFKKDIPLFIEIDYISMTIILLNYNFNVNSLDYYNFKFINLYLNRLYNWKYII